MQIKNKNRLYPHKFLKNDQDQNPGNEYDNAPEDRHDDSDKCIGAVQPCESGVYSRPVGAEIDHRQGREREKYRFKKGTHIFGNIEDKKISDHSRDHMPNISAAESRRREEGMLSAHVSFGPCLYGEDSASDIITEFPQYSHSAVFCPGASFRDAPQ